MTDPREELELAIVSAELVGSNRITMDLKKATTLFHMIRNYRNEIDRQAKQLEALRLELRSCRATSSYNRYLQEKHVG